MSIQDIEDRIAKITWGGKHSIVLNGQGDEVVIIFKSLSLRQKSFVSFIHSKAIKDASAKGVLTRFEMKKLLKERNIWTPHDDETIKLSTDRIRELLNAQDKLKKNSREYKRNQVMLSGHLKAFNELKTKQRDLFSPTAEVHSEEIRTLALIYSLAYNENEKKLWSSWDSFLAESDKTFVSNLIISLSETISTTDIKDIREIARSAQWRFKWAGAKNNIGVLFDRPLGELDMDQQNLLYWSQVYDSVYEAHEPPDDDVIDNDARLDKWFEERGRKRKAEKVEGGKSLGNIQLSNKMRGHGEIFIMANPDINPNAPTTQEIEALNSPSVRRFKKKESERIKQKGEISEKDLRSRNNKISRRIIGSTDAVLGRNSMGQAKGGRAASKQFPGGTI